MEIAVRKATRLEYRPPKEKHLITLRSLTFENPAIIDSMLMCLEKRLKERSWIITFKVLVILHYLMREGNSIRVIDAILKRPEVLDTSNIKNKSSSPTNVQNIYLYRAYLDEKLLAFKSFERDFVNETTRKKGVGRLRHLSIAGGLLKETSSLQHQMESALKCTFHLNDKDTQITFFAYRMVIDDILALFQSMNEGVVNILEHYFEMKKSDAKQSLGLYKTFAQQTELTVEYLNAAKKLENDIHMNIPTIKHAPLSLVTALEEYLDQISNEQSKPTITESPTQMQQSLPQASSSPLQQQESQSLFDQQFFQPQPYQVQTFQQAYSQPPVQYDLFNNSSQNMMAVDRQMTGMIDQGTTSNVVASSNPFLNMINQQPTGTQVYASLPTQMNRFSTLPPSSTNSNPFRSLTMSTNDYSTAVVKHQSLAIQPVTNSNNPFTPMITPPLTPNQPLNSTFSSPNPFAHQNVVNYQQNSLF